MVMVNGCANTILSGVFWKDARGYHVVCVYILGILSVSGLWAILMLICYANFYACDVWCRVDQSACDVIVIGNATLMMSETLNELGRLISRWNQIFLIQL